MPAQLMTCPLSQRSLPNVFCFLNEYKLFSTPPFLLLPAAQDSQVSYIVRSEVTVISSWGELDMKYQSPRDKGPPPL